MSARARTWIVDGLAAVVLVALGMWLAPGVAVLGLAAIIVLVAAGIVHLVRRGRRR